MGTYKAPKRFCFGVVVGGATSGLLLVKYLVWGLGGGSGLLRCFWDFFLAVTRGEPLDPRVLTASTIGG